MTERDQHKRTTHAEKANRRMNLTLAVAPSLISFILAFFAGIDGHGYAAAALLMAGAAWSTAEFRELDD